jgi:hypothetical protein
MSKFDTDTAITRQAQDGPLGPTYDVDLNESWSIGNKPNGGYSLAILGRAACDAVETVHPLAVSAHYLRAPESAPAEVRTEIIRKGRRASTVRATLWQNGKPCIESLITSGELQADAEVDYLGVPAPDLPPPGEGVVPDNPFAHIALFDSVELRLDPVTAPFPKASGTPELRFWFRFTDGAEPDVLSLLLAVDSGPPTVFHLEKYGWAPTVELSVLLRGIPAPGWMKVVTKTETLAGGWFDEGATVWDSTGRLVAQSRQLALTAGG